jgi:uncharacterized membrane protein
MAHAKNEVIIDCPIDEVFAYVANGENNAHWRGSILEVERTSDHDGLNATYKQAISGPNGRKVRHDYRVDAFESPRKLHFQHIVGLARPEGLLEFTPVDADHTQVMFEMDWKPKVYTRMLDKMIETWMTGEVALLGELKKRLEKS